MAAHPVPPPPGVKKVIVGIESHRYQGSGPLCLGTLGFTAGDPRQGELCSRPRSALIHSDRLNWCVICNSRIETMTFKGTGVCSENHRKERDGEPIHKYRAVAP